MIVSSETFPSRLPTRPALSTGGGGVVAASDVRSLEDLLQRRLAELGCVGEQLADPA